MLDADEVVALEDPDSGVVLVLVLAAEDVALDGDEPPRLSVL